MAANLTEYQKEERDVGLRTRIRKPKKYRKNLNRGPKRPDLMQKRVVESDPDMKKTDKNDLDLSLRSRYALIASNIVLAKKIKAEPDIVSGADLPYPPDKPELANQWQGRKVSTFHELYNILTIYHREVHGVHVKNTLDAINWADSEGYRFVNILDSVLSSIKADYTKVIAGYHTNFVGFVVLADFVNRHGKDRTSYTITKRSLAAYFSFLNRIFVGLEKTVSREYQQWKAIFEKSSSVSMEKFSEFLESYGKSKIDELTSRNAIISQDEALKTIFGVGFYSLLAQKLNNDLVGSILDVDPDLQDVYKNIISGNGEEAIEQFTKVFSEQRGVRDVPALLNKMMGVFVYQIINDDFLDSYLRGSEDPLTTSPTVAIENVNKLNKWLEENRKNILELVRERVLDQEFEEMLAQSDWQVPEEEDWSDPRNLIKQMVVPDKVPDFVYKNEALKAKYESTKKVLDKKLKDGDITKNYYDEEMVKLNRDLGKDSLRDLMRRQSSYSYSLNETVSTGMNTRLSTYHGVDDRDFYPIPTFVPWDVRYFNKEDERAIIASAKSLLKTDWCKYGWEGGSQDAPFRSALDLTIATIEDAKYAGRIGARLYDSLLNQLMGGKSDPYSETLFVEEKTSPQRKQASMENRVASAEVPLSTLIRVAFENPGARSVLLPIIAAAGKKSKKDEPKKATPKSKEEPKKAAPKDKEEPKKAAPKAKEEPKKATPKSKKPPMKKRKASSNAITMEDINWV